MNVKEFYNSGVGTSLVNEQNYPASISDFLEEEAQSLHLLCMVKVKMLVEVGCMEGRYIEWALKRGLNYLGLDVAPSYIKSARERLKLLNTDPVIFRCLCADASRLHLILSAYNIPANEVMVFFPFNCFGNIENMGAVVKSLVSARVNFLISTYKTDNYANEERLKYYVNCKYSNIRQISSAFGVRFVSDEGLNTIAFSSRYVKKMFMRHGLEVTTIPIGDVGLGYIHNEQGIKEVGLE